MQFFLYVVCFYRFSNRGILLSKATLITQFSSIFRYKKIHWQYIIYEYTTYTMKRLTISSHCLKPLFVGTELKDANIIIIYNLSMSASWMVFKKQMLDIVTI